MIPKTSTVRLAGLVSILALGLLAAAPAMAAADKMALGRKVFTELAQPPCSLCHILADAGANSEVGPNLDQLRPDPARVKTAVTQGIGAMPANPALKPEEVDAVAAYVASVSGGGAKPAAGR